MAKIVMSEIVQSVIGKKSIDCSKRSCIKSVLKKLRKREHDLKDELKDEKSDKRVKKLSRDIKVLHAQRHKGLKVLKSLD
ncbi:MAG: hypothetical protein HQL49_02515 [Gammaproteobacteria bacterium]|nr:hypothetical protein [Gammaproteobacteria bacterium]